MPVTWTGRPGIVTLAVSVNHCHHYDALAIGASVTESGCSGWALTDSEAIVYYVNPVHPGSLRLGRLRPGPRRCRSLSAWRRPP